MKRLTEKYQQEWDEINNPIGSKQKTEWVGRKNTLVGHPAEGEGTRPEHTIIPLYSLNQVCRFLEVIIPEAFEAGERFAKGVNVRFHEGVGGTFTEVSSDKPDLETFLSTVITEEK